MKASKSDGRQNGGFRESRYGNPGAVFDIAFGERGNDGGALC